jgi:uncharacterized protein (TIGR04141 family)
MPEKTHPFSIFLLKNGFNPTNSLANDHGLQLAVGATNLPTGTSLYILDSERTRPWWRSYFGVQEELWQQFKGALLFLEANERWFALSFGQVFHHLKDEAYEYDFGLRVTLNSLDPNELKSADMIEPGPARRKRTQVPISTDLTFLDFDGNTEIIKSLTGKVKEEHRTLFKTATGSASLKISLKLSPQNLAARCAALLTLYQSEEYKTTFPNIQNIVPVRDPHTISVLDGLLLKSIHENDKDTTLTIPDIVDYRDNTCCIFTGANGASEIYPDISIEKFYEYLGDDFEIETLTLDDIKSYRLVLTDVEGNQGPSYGLYRSLIFDTSIPNDDTVVYHLNEGNWYKAESSFLARIKTYLDYKCETTDLCPYDHDETKGGKLVYSEGRYNAEIPQWNTRYICLDRTDISPTGSTTIEPCDLYTVEPDTTSSCGVRAKLYHIKISTRSSHLSHLFNQGVNSLELIELEPQSRDKFKALIAENLNGNSANEFSIPFERSDFKLIFGIITHKQAALKSDALPLFSKISLMRNMQRLDLMRVPVALAYIPDASPAKGGHPKHQQYVVVVSLGNKGNEIKAVAGQGLDTQIPIKRCPSQLKESAVGTRYRLTVKVNSDGSLASFHSWPYELHTD